MDAMDAIMTRRSTRRMKPEIPERERIEQIVEAGRAAPSGSDSQTTRFLVITDPQVLKELKELASRAFAEMELREPPCRSPRIHQVTPASCSESDTDIR